MQSTKIEPKVYRGLECPKCGCRHFWTVHTLPRTKCVVRRRQCRHCGWVVRTQEKIG